MTEPETNGLDVDGFLGELAELTKKYSISIGGCGCCGSPYLYLNAVDYVELGDGLTYHSAAGEYRLNP